MTADSVPHPFLELSILEYTSPAHNDMKQYKYIHALIQVKKIMEWYLPMQYALRNDFVQVLRLEDESETSLPFLGIG